MKIFENVSYLSSFDQSPKYQEENVCQFQKLLIDCKSSLDVIHLLKTFPLDFEFCRINLRLWIPHLNMLDMALHDLIECALFWDEFFIVNCTYSRRILRVINFNCKNVSCSTSFDIVIENIKFLLSWFVSLLQFAVNKEVFNSLELIALLLCSSSWELSSKSIEVFYALSFLSLPHRDVLMHENYTLLSAELKDSNFVRQSGYWKDFSDEKWERHDGFGPSQCLEILGAYVSGTLGPQRCSLLKIFSSEYENSLDEDESLSLLDVVDCGFVHKGFFGNVNSKKIRIQEDQSCLIPFQRCESDRSDVSSSGCENCNVEKNSYDKTNFSVFRPELTSIEKERVRKLSWRDEHSQVLSSVNVDFEYRYEIHHRVISYRMEMNRRNNISTRSSLSYVDDLRRIISEFSSVLHSCVVLGANVTHSIFFFEFFNGEIIYRCNNNVTSKIFPRACRKFSMDSIWNDIIFAIQFLDDDFVQRYIDCNKFVGDVDKLAKDIRQLRLTCCSVISSILSRMGDRNVNSALKLSSKHYTVSFQSFLKKLYGSSYISKVSPYQGVTESVEDRGKVVIELMFAELEYLIAMQEKQLIDQQNDEVVISRIRYSEMIFMMGYSFMNFEGFIIQLVKLDFMSYLSQLFNHTSENSSIRQHPVYLGVQSLLMFIWDSMIVSRPIARKGFQTMNGIGVILIRLQQEIVFCQEYLKPNSYFQASIVPQFSFILSLISILGSCFDSRGIVFYRDVILSNEFVDCCIGTLSISKDYCPLLFSSLILLINRIIDKLHFDRTTVRLEKNIVNDISTISENIVQSTVMPLVIDNESSVISFFQKKGLFSCIRNTFLDMPMTMDDDFFPSFFKFLCISIEIWSIDELRLMISRMIGAFHDDYFLASESFLMFTSLPDAIGKMIKEMIVSNYLKNDAEKRMQISSMITDCIVNEMNSHFVLLTTSKSSLSILNNQLRIFGFMKMLKGILDENNEVKDEENVMVDFWKGLISINGFVSLFNNILLAFGDNSYFAMVLNLSHEDDFGLKDFIMNSKMEPSKGPIRNSLGSWKNINVIMNWNQEFLWSIIHSLIGFLSKNEDKIDLLNQVLMVLDNSMKGIQDLQRDFRFSSQTEKTTEIHEQRFSLLRLSFLYYSILFQFTNFVKSFPKMSIDDVITKFVMNKLETFCNFECLKDSYCIFRVDCDVENSFKYHNGLDIVSADNIVEYRFINLRNQTIYLFKELAGKNNEDNSFPVFSAWEPGAYLSFDDVIHTYGASHYKRFFSFGPKGFNNEGAILISDRNDDDTEDSLYLQIFEVISTDGSKISWSFESTLWKLSQYIKSGFVQLRWNFEYLSNSSMSKTLPKLSDSGSPIISFSCDFIYEIVEAVLSSKFSFTDNTLDILVSVFCSGGLESRLVEFDELIFLFRYLSIIALECFIRKSSFLMKSNKIDMTNEDNILQVDKIVKIFEAIYLDLSGYSNPLCLKLIFSTVDLIGKMTLGVLKSFSKLAERVVSKWIIISLRVLVRLSPFLGKSCFATVDIKHPIHVILGNIERREWLGNERDLFIGMRKLMECLCLLSLNVIEENEAIEFDNEFISKKIFDVNGVSYLHFRRISNIFIVLFFAKNLLDSFLSIDFELGSSGNELEYAGDLIKNFLLTLVQCGNDDELGYLFRGILFHESSTLCNFQEKLLLFLRKSLIRNYVSSSYFELCTNIFYTLRLLQKEIPVNSKSEVWLTNSRYYYKYLETLSFICTHNCELNDVSNIFLSRLPIQLNDDSLFSLAQFFSISSLYSSDQIGFDNMITICFEFLDHVQNSAHDLQEVRTSVQSSLFHCILLLNDFHDKSSHLSSKILIRSRVLDDHFFDLFRLPYDFLSSSLLTFLPISRLFIKCLHFAGDRSQDFIYHVQKNLLDVSFGIQLNNEIGRSSFSPFVLSTFAQTFHDFGLKNEYFDDESLRRICSLVPKFWVNPSDDNIESNICNKRGISKILEYSPSWLNNESLSQFDFVSGFSERSSFLKNFKAPLEIDWKSIVRMVCIRFDSSTCALQRDAFNSCVSSSDYYGCKRYMQFLIALIVSMPGKLKEEVAMFLFSEKIMRNDLSFFEYMFQFIFLGVPIMEHSCDEENIHLAFEFSQDLISTCVLFIYCFVGFEGFLRREICFYLSSSAISHLNCALVRSDENKLVLDNFLMAKLLMAHKIMGVIATLMSDNDEGLSAIDGLIISFNREEIGASFHALFTSEILMTYSSLLIDVYIESTECDYVEYSSSVFNMQFARVVMWIINLLNYMTDIDHTIKNYVMFRISERFSLLSKSNEQNEASDHLLDIKSFMSTLLSYFDGLENKYKHLRFFFDFNDSDVSLVNGSYVWGLHKICQSHFDWLKIFNLSSDSRSGLKYHEEGQDGFDDESAEESWNTIYSNEDERNSILDVHTSLNEQDHVDPEKSDSMSESVWSSCSDDSLKSNNSGRVCDPTPLNPVSPTPSSSSSSSSSSSASSCSASSSSPSSKSSSSISSILSKKSTSNMAWLQELCSSDNDNDIEHDEKEIVNSSNDENIATDESNRNSNESSVNSDSDRDEDFSELQSTNYSIGTDIEDFNRLGEEVLENDYQLDDNNDDGSNPSEAHLDRGDDHGNDESERIPLIPDLRSIEFCREITVSNDGVCSDMGIRRTLFFDDPNHSLIFDNMKVSSASFTDVLVLAVPAIFRRNTDGLDVLGVKKYHEYIKKLRNNGNTLDFNVSIFSSFLIDYFDQEQSYLENLSNYFVFALLDSFSRLMSGESLIESSVSLNEDNVISSVEAARTSLETINLILDFDWFIFEGAINLLLNVLEQDIRRIKFSQSHNGVPRGLKSLNSNSATSYEQLYKSLHGENIVVDRSVSIETAFATLLVYCDLFIGDRSSYIEHMSKLRKLSCVDIQGIHRSFDDLFLSKISNIFDISESVKKDWFGVVLMDYYIREILFFLDILEQFDTNSSPIMIQCECEVSNDNDRSLKEEDFPLPCSLFHRFMKLLVSILNLWFSCSSMIFGRKDIVENYLFILQRFFSIFEYVSRTALVKYLGNNFFMFCSIFASFAIFVFRGETQISSRLRNLLAEAYQHIRSTKSSIDFEKFQKSFYGWFFGFIEIRVAILVNILSDSSDQYEKKTKYSYSDGTELNQSRPLSEIFDTILSTWDLSLISKWERARVELQLICCLLKNFWLLIQDDQDKNAKSSDLLRQVAERVIFHPEIWSLLSNMLKDIEESSSFQNPFISRSSRYSKIILYVMEFSSFMESIACFDVLSVPNMFKVAVDTVRSQLGCDIPGLNDGRQVVLSRIVSSKSSLIEQVLEAIITRTDDHFSKTLQDFFLEEVYLPLYPCQWYFLLSPSHSTLLSFDTKRKLFYRFLSFSKFQCLAAVHQLEKENHEMMFSLYPREVEVIVKRSNLVQSSFSAFEMVSLADLWTKSIKVSFEDEMGVDGGGLSKEWVSLLTREVFVPAYGLFVPFGEEGNFIPNHDSTSLHSDSLQWYYVVGRFFAKALFDRQTVEANFAYGFLKYLLNRPVDYVDIDKDDHVMYRSFEEIMNNSLDDLKLDLFFTYERRRFDNTLEVVDLRNPEIILNETTSVSYEFQPVTDENKEEYLNLLSKYILCDSVLSQMKHFRDGFFSLIPVHFLDLFSPEELKILLCGMPEMNIDDLERHTIYHGYKASDLTIRIFWNVLRKLSMHQKLSFLQFVTGSKSIPLGGFASLRTFQGVQWFTIERVSDTKLLPSAHTCFHQIDLPPYDNEDELEEKLLRSIDFGKEGFGFI